MVRICQIIDRVLLPESNTNHHSKEGKTFWATTGADWERGNLSRRRSKAQGREKEELGGGTAVIFASLCKTERP